MTSPDRHDVPPARAGFPLFGAWNQREFDGSPWPMRIFDHETLRYLAVNDAALKLYGYTREEFLALTARDTRHPDEHLRLVASLNESTGFMRYRGPRRHLKKSGEVMVVEVVTQDVIYDGRLARLAMTIDVTDRVRMQELVLRREQEFETLAENLPDPVARFDRGYRFVYVNSAVEKLTGRNRSDMIGRTQRELQMPSDLVELFERSLVEAIDTADVLLFEFRYPAQDGERRFEAYHVPERGADGRVATVLCVARDITDRKKAEDALLESRERFRTVTETANDAIVSSDSSGNITYFNRAAFRIFGYTAEEALGQPLTILMPERFHAAHKAGLQRLIAGQPSNLVGKTTELVGRRKDGTEFSLELSLASMRLGSGAFFTGIIRDITGRKRTEDSLRETNEFLRRVIESSRDCVKVLDLEGRLESMSHGGQRLMEIDDITPLLNRSWIEFWKDADREAAARAIDAARNGGTGCFEGYCPTVKGDPRWWDVMVSPILDAAGRPQRLLAVSRDITRRRQIHNALRESEERFRQLAENIREVFWISNLKGENMYVSPAYEEIWGKSVESLIRNPQSWMDSIYPDDLPAVRASLENLSRSLPTEVEYRIIRPDGTLRWIRDRSYPMKRSDGTLLTCGIADDITRLKQAEEERLIHAARQRDALVREVRHRIQNSLQGVAGLLRQKVRKYPAIAPGVEEAIAQLQSVALVYGLQETRPDGLIALSEIMNEVCASAEGLTGGTVEKARERKSSRPACVAGAEAVSVAVALNELVFNALKHQTGAGRKRARVTLLESRDSAEIRIANRGKLPKGFDFPAGRGMGDGLGLVRTLLAPPGGDIAFNGGRNEVEVIVKLVPPLLALRRQAIAR